MCRYAYTGYQNVLNQLKAYVRGEMSGKTQLIHELRILDNVTEIVLSSSLQEIKKTVSYMRMQKQALLVEAVDLDMN